MTDMIERVARVLARYEAVEVDDEHRGMARAAIEAMREPTPEMIAATGLRIGAVLDSYQAMIAAALKPEVQP